MFTVQPTSVLMRFKSICQANESELHTVRSLYLAPFSVNECTPKQKLSTCGGCYVCDYMSVYC